MSLDSDPAVGMFKRPLSHWLSAIRGFWRAPSSAVASRAELVAGVTEDAGRGVADLVPYDESLLERSRSQWELGDWDGLAGIAIESIQHHPDRARLALLAAAGRLQTNQATEARALLRQAMSWGCSRKLVSQILVAGVHNQLGRSAVVAGMDERASMHFESAIRLGNPQADARLIGHARAVRELVSLGMLPKATTYLEQSANRMKQAARDATHAEAQQKVLAMEVDWLRDRVSQLHKQSMVAQLTAAATARKEMSSKAVAAPPAAGEAKKYFALNGLDRKLESYLDIDGGFFVELGANDGISQSNSLYFERERGWRGVLIEPILHNFMKCQSNRSADNTFFCAACVSEDYQMPYVRLTYSNLMTAPHGVASDIADPAAHAHSGAVYLRQDEKPVEVMAVARTLSNLLDEANAPPEMDLLSLDVEGGELEVLRGLDHRRHRFRYMLVECRDPQRMAKYLAEVGYVLVDKISEHDYLYAAR